MKTHLYKQNITLGDVLRFNIKQTNLEVKLYFIKSTVFNQTFQLLSLSYHYRHDVLILKHFSVIKVTLLNKNYNVCFIR